jgi:hypothetical protein
MQLNPLNALLTIDENTPGFMIEYTERVFRVQVDYNYWGARAYTSEFNRIINERARTLPLYPTDNQEELKECARIVNPSSKEWTEVSIRDAVESLMVYLQVDFVLPDIDELEFGAKTNAHPLRINELMAYRICRHFNYSITNNTTIEELYHACTHFLKPQGPSDARDFLMRSLSSVPNEVLVRLAFEFAKTPVHESTSTTVRSVPTVHEYDASMIKHSHALVQSPTYLHQRMVPENPVEAIVMTAVRFRISTVEAQDPIRQYRLLMDKRLTAKNIDKYVPVMDPGFMNNYVRNPKWYSMDNNWFELFMETYTTKELLAFSLMEGYPDPRTQNAGVLTKFLLSRRQTNTFYFGFNPHATTDVTYHLESITLINSNDLIAYGTIGQRMDYMTIDELIAYFNSARLFIDPITKGNMDSFAINKLKRYVDESTKSIEKELETVKTDTILCRRRQFNTLKTTIIEIQNALSVIDSTVKELCIRIQSLDEDDKTAVKNYFRSIIDMGFYARGWKLPVIQGYPLKESTYEKSLYDAMVFDNTFIAWQNCMDALEKIPRELRPQIEALNLLMFSDAGEPIRVFGDTISGFTISRDLTVLECMENTTHDTGDPSVSCIRTNSSYLLFSGGCYSIMSGFGIDFQLSDIRIVK